MPLTWILRYFALMTYEVSASPLLGAGVHIPGLYLPLNVSRSTSTSILPLSNISTKKALNVECDGARYGDNLSIADCKDAKGYIFSGSKQFAWVARHTPFQKAHFALPYRYMGGTYRSP